MTSDVLPIAWSSRLRAFLPSSYELYTHQNDSRQQQQLLSNITSTGDGGEIDDNNRNNISSTPTSSNSFTSRPTISSSIASHTDKIVLPPSALQSLLGQTPDASLLPSPLLFRLTNPSNGKVTHVGVKEFSADEGTVQIPIGVARNLMLSTDNDLVLANFVILPKGTSLTLKKEFDSTSDGQSIDWKALLESRLHAAFTALTLGDILSVSHPSLPNRSLDFRIEKLEPENPSNGVCIVDTDLDLEIIDEEANNHDNSGIAGSSDSRGIRRLPYSDPVKLIVNSNEPVEVTDLATTETGRFLVEIDNNNNKPVTVLVEDVKFNDIHSDPESLLIFVGNDESASDNSFLWSSLLSPGSVSIPADDPFLESSSNRAKLYISVQSRSSSASFSIRVTTESGSNHIDHDMTMMVDSNTKVCPNCHQNIPTQSFSLHSSFCERNNLLCPEGCGKIFPRREGIPTSHWHCHEHDIFGDSEYSFELHEDYFHTPSNCPACIDESADMGSFVNRVALAQHSATICPAKLHICRFCHLRLPQERASATDLLQGLTGHESYCGNRTTDCEVCKRVVRLKELQTHLEFHKMDRLNQSVPILCSNVNCPRLVDNANANSLGLCAACFGPLHSTLLDPTGSKLRSRIERRYVIQLTRGCGKPWCMNQSCKNGGSKPKQTMAEIINGELKSLTDLAINSNKFSFCVDEGATKRLLFVQFESGEGIYDAAWCAKAIEQAKGNESEARRWLELNSVRKDEM